MSIPSAALPRVGVYVRQSVNEEEGITQQLVECDAELARRKWSRTETYVDNDVSASTERGAGTGWARMLADVDAGRIDTVVVVAVDRLMRRLADVLEIRPPRRDVRVIVVRGGIDTGDSSGMGGFILGLFVLVAEQEIHTRRRRAIPYRDARHAAGVPTPGRVPYGYRWVGKAERVERQLGELRYEVVPDEAAVVQFIFRSAFAQISTAKGIELGSLARDLNAGSATDEQGVPLGDHSRQRDGRKWIASTVRRLLLSPYYAALLPPISSTAARRDDDTGKVRSWSASEVDIDSCIPGNWTPLVSADTLRSIRHSLLNPSRRTNGGTTSRKWLLSGLARCGAVLSEDAATGAVEMCGTPVRSAVTREGHRGYRCPHGHFLRRAEVIDAYVVEKAIERLSRPDAGSLLRPPVDVDVPGLQAQEKALNARRMNVLRLVASGDYDHEEGEMASKGLRAKLAAVRSQLDAVYAADPLSEAVSVQDVRTYWEGLILGRQRAIIDALMSPVIEPVGKGKVVTAANVGRTVLTGWRVPHLPDSYVDDVPLTDALRSAL